MEENKSIFRKISHKDIDFIKKVNEVYTKNETMVIATRLNDGQRDIFDNTKANKSKANLK